MVPPVLVSGSVAVIAFVILLARLTNIRMVYEGMLNQLVDKVPNVVILTIGVLSSLFSGVQLWSTELSSAQYSNFGSVVFLLILPAIQIWIVMALRERT